MDYNSLLDEYMDNAKNKDITQCARAVRKAISIDVLEWLSHREHRLFLNNEKQNSENV